MKSLRSLNWVIIRDHGPEEQHLPRYPEKLWVWSLTYCTSQRVGTHERSLAGSGQWPLSHQWGNGMENSSRSEHSCMLGGAGGHRAEPAKVHVSKTYKWKLSVLFFFDGFGFF